MPTEKYFLIVNLIAGRGHCKTLFPKVKLELDRRGIDYDLHYTNEPLEAVDVAKMGIEAGFTRIVAMGGDGTVNEVANGLLGTNATLGVIPAGTGNDFVRVMGIPSDPLAALDVLTRGTERQIDVGRVAEDRYFVNGVGIGIDAQVARDVLAMERLRGAPAYLYAAAKEVFRFPAFDVRLEAEGWNAEVNCLSLGIANGKYCGGGFMLAPRALVDDGLIDISAIGDFPRLERLFRLPQARAGKHIDLPQVRYHQAAEATVSSEA
ncbi:MAG: diacylglycerol kinase family lipid kinase, partial [Candidatus Bipolaricaulis sp.]|nr:diacylglycerol kinase family lipid kinase [Candidatus Bipolaricaulis sp.]